jgi:hypothetical protein
VTDELVTPADLAVWVAEATANLLSGEEQTLGPSRRILRLAGELAKRTLADDVVMLQDMDDLDRILNTTVPSRVFDLVKQMLERKRGQYEKAITRPG